MKKFLFIMALCFLLNAGQANAGLIVNDTVEPVLATGLKVDNVADLKCGKESIVHILGITSFGYAGIYDIAAHNGITQIHHVDVRKKWFFGFGTTTVRVYGL